MSTFPVEGFKHLQILPYREEAAELRADAQYYCTKAGRDGLALEH
ncbi:MAG TPA: hypothetical protein VJQ25_02695 [Nitrospira sp.]|nr:hypothetical protein [Nitrospira sp.]